MARRRPACERRARPQPHRSAPRPDTPRRRSVPSCRGSRPRVTVTMSSTNASRWGHGRSPTCCTRSPSAIVRAICSAGQRHPMPGLPARQRVGRDLRLDADHPRPGSCELGARSDPSGEPAAGDRHVDHRWRSRASGQVVEDLAPRWCRSQPAPRRCRTARSGSARPARPARRPVAAAPALSERPARPSRRATWSAAASSAGTSSGMTTVTEHCRAPSGHRHRDRVVAAGMGHHAPPERRVRPVPAAS